MIPYPNLNPVALRLGPLAIRWYALAYITGIVGSFFYIRRLNRRLPIPNLTDKALEDGFTYAVLGIVLGGRIGYVLFYNLPYYMAHPLHAFAVWEGGMSFHGGMIGIAVAFYFFCRRFRVPFLMFLDVLACAAPIGLFFGRLANFVNGELFGRVTDVPWAMIFPRGGPLPRHPSQLYEASLEGVALFLILFLLARFTRIRSLPGMLTGVFLIGYSLSRMTVEFFRQPDVQLGFVLGPFTMGQLLSLPMLIAGVLLLFRPLRASPRHA